MNSLTNTDTQHQRPEDVEAGIISEMSEDDEEQQLQQQQPVTSTTTSSSSARPPSPPQQQQQQKEEEEEVEEEQLRSLESAAAASSSEAPDWASCPITGELMGDPVQVECPSHHTFERYAIEEWIVSRGNTTCPMDRVDLKTLTLNPHKDLRERISNFVGPQVFSYWVLAVHEKRRKQQLKDLQRKQKQQQRQEQREQQQQLATGENHQDASRTIGPGGNSEQSLSGKRLFLLRLGLAFPFILVMLVLLAYMIRSNYNGTMSNGGEDPYVYVDNSDD